jgi:hypothetical protein
MRLAVPILCACVLSACLLATAALAGPAEKRAPVAGKLVVTEARGKIVLTGSGVLLGSLGAGTIEIRDLTPKDSYSPRLNGVPRGKLVRHRGKNVRFVVPDGRYRIVVRGEGISLSARGSGVVVLHGDPDSVGDTGTYLVDSTAAAPLPAEPTRVAFGKLPGETTDAGKSGGTTDGARSTP